MSIDPELNSKLVPAHIKPVLAQRGLDIDSPDFKPLTKEQMKAHLD